MAPMRAERGGSPARGDRASLPLPRRLIRQIARHVASSGRSLQRLEISGRVIDNFDDYLDAEDSDNEPATPGVASAGGVGALSSEQDDDLTSLSWLQDRNLLRGINLTKSMGEKKVAEVQLIYQSNEMTVTASTPPSAGPLSPPRTPCKPPQPPSPPALAKPPYSFSCLIFMAIEASPAGALPVKEIYAWIVRHFPYFREAPQGWKNSVRHNLSLNKCFHKVATATTLGKGSLWSVDPQHRAGLIQAFGRQAAPPPPPPAPALPEEDTSPQSGKNDPDPSLFPFLARRLAGEPQPPGVDEYLAAATVLAMKYGPAVLDRLPPAPDRLPPAPDRLPPAPGRLVISRSPRDEHTYTSRCAGEERRTAEALLNLAGVLIEPACELHSHSRKRRLEQR